ncbi:MAG: hypothetical protein ACOYXC_05030, partial [Candidatus Rifleibacteriota bacterium]
MPENPGFFFFHFLARIFGSIFFPLFDAYGENEFKNRAGRVVFARSEGFISALNILRFFKTPVIFFVRREDTRKFFWRLLITGGVNVSEIDSEATVSQIRETVSNTGNDSETPVYLIDQAFQKFDDELIRSFSPDKVLFLAITAAGNAFSAAIVPVVRDTKALCAAVPAFSGNQEEFAGLRGLEFLEKSLAL